MALVLEVPRGESNAQERSAALRSLAARTVMLNPSPKAFDEKFATLCRFVAEFGHARPAKRYVTPEGYQLGRWVFHLRDTDRRHYLSRRQEERLEGLPGWTWHLGVGTGRASSGAGSLHGGPAWHTPRLEHLRGRNVVLLDMDATLYDPWSCPGCGFKERTLRASKNKHGEVCSHLRRDTLAQVAELCSERDALVVVCSYRHGRLSDTKSWVEQDLALPELHPAAYVLPGAPDDCSYQSSVLVSGLLKSTGSPGGQVSFKARAADALQKRWGARLVGAFDDNATVCEAYESLGVGHVVRVRYLVDIKPWEWSAGHLGAPKPSPLPAVKPWPGPASRPGDVLHGEQRSFWQDHREGNRSNRRHGPVRPRDGGHSHYSSLGGYFVDEGQEDYGVDLDDLEQDLAPAHFKAGDQVRFFGVRQSSLGEVMGEEDGYVVVLDESDRIVYLKPEEVTRI